MFAAGATLNHPQQPARMDEDQAYLDYLGGGHSMEGLVLSRKRKADMVAYKSKGGEMPIVAELDPIDVIVTETEVILNDIFFEYNKSNITKEGAFELDKLVQVMKNNEKMVILAKSHTDNRGTDKYNERLSDRRAKSTAQYIISKGIAANRISAKGMGELEPKVDCGKDCSEEQHAQNRRSEFLIIKKVQD